MKLLHPLTIVYHSQPQELRQLGLNTAQLYLSWPESLAAAGEHLLTQITPTVYVAGTAHTRPSLNFAYSNPLTDKYRDPNQGYSTQTTWQYLTWYQDQQTGVGASISYAAGYANMEGTPTWPMRRATSSMTVTIHSLVPLTPPTAIRASNVPGSMPIQRTGAGACS